MTPTDMTQKEKAYSEKRNFIRMFVNAKVTVTDPENGETYIAEGKNLSGDGAMFTSSQEFTVNQRLSLDIQSEQSTLASLKADFEVIRVTKRDDGQFDIAGAMLDVK